MKLTYRKYQTEDDYWTIRRFLRQVFMLHDRREVGWPLYRWDYWRWHVNENIFRFDLSAAVFMWETDDDRLAAVVHPDGPGEAFLQVQALSIYTKKIVGGTFSWFYLRNYLCHSILSRNVWPNSKNEWLQRKPQTGRNYVYQE